MAVTATVKAWDRLVGGLAFDPESRITTFEYGREWIESGLEIAPIKMPLAQGKFQFPALNWDTYRGLPAVFSDSLPDDFGNALINAWLAREGRDIDSFSPVERLLYAGNRGMGALEYHPAIARAKIDARQNLELDSLIEMAQRILDERGHYAGNLKDSREEALTQLLQVGTSPGGARPKAAIAINKTRTQLRSGQVDAPPGFEHYLLKFDGVVEHRRDHQNFGDPQGYGRMEYAYYLMARDCEIQMSPSELLEDGERAHFMTRRFDRAGNFKIHVQTLCAMDHADYKMPGAYSYEQLLSVARLLKLPRKDATELFRRMVFNVIARNQDDHSKNFSFMFDNEANRWVLAPAYDVVFSYKKDSPWVHNHQMTINGKRDRFTRDDLMVLANTVTNFKREAAQIIDRTLDVVSNWPVYSQAAHVAEDFSKRIRNLHRLDLN
jgi:serine/threonine-protein kinase HipA